MVLRPRPVKDHITEFSNNNICTDYLALENIQLVFIVNNFWSILIWIFFFFRWWKRSEKLLDLWRPRYRPALRHHLVRGMQGLFQTKHLQQESIPVHQKQKLHYVAKATKSMSVLSLAQVPSDGNEQERYYIITAEGYAEDSAACLFTCRSDNRKRNSVIMETIISAFRKRTEKQTSISLRPAWG